ncbi:MAG: LysR family transcriptional regulator [Hyphomicrobiales bacterium]|nr:LysR family transcriptional regulator [Hyphomicrobiales bacterium]
MVRAEHLCFVDAVARLPQLGRAAEACAMSQPAQSILIGMLERRLCVALLQFCKSWPRRVRNPCRAQPAASIPAGHLTRAVPLPSSQTPRKPLAHMRISQWHD